MHEANRKALNGFPENDPKDLIRFMVEALHEDLNMVHVRPPAHEIEVTPALSVDENLLSEAYFEYFNE